MRTLRRVALRQLVRSFQGSTASALHECQTIIIVFLAMLVWMLWAILRFGELPAFLLTVPTSCPALAWLERRRVWLDRRDERADTMRMRFGSPPPAS